MTWPEHRLPTTPDHWTAEDLRAYITPLYPHTRANCPRPHRFPEGPNEDLGCCPECGGISWELRPEGQTYGYHDTDCSLPNRHEGHCVGGGAGHPAAAKIRGYFDRGA